MFVAQKNHQRRIFPVADDFACVLLLFADRKEFFARSGSKYSSSTLAAGNFLHNRRVNVFLRDFSVRNAAKTAEKVFKLARKEFVLRLPGSPADNNLFVARVGQIGINHDRSKRNYLLRRNFDDNFACERALEVNQATFLTLDPCKSVQFA